MNKIKDVNIHLFEIEKEKDNNNENIIIIYNFDLYFCKYILALYKEIGTI